MFLGTALLSGLGASVAYFVVGIAVIELKLRAEERLPIATLGEPYLRYKERVPQPTPGLKLLRRHIDTADEHSTDAV